MEHGAIKHIIEDHRKSKIRLKRALQGTLVAASGASSDKLHFEAFSPSVAGRGKAEAILPSGEKRTGQSN